MKELLVRKYDGYHGERMEQLSQAELDIAYFERLMREHNTDTLFHFWQDSQGEPHLLEVDKTTLTMMKGASSGIYQEFRSDGYQPQEIVIFQTQK